MTSLHQVAPARRSNHQRASRSIWIAIIVALVISGFAIPSRADAAPPQEPGSGSWSDDFERAVPEGWGDQYVSRPATSASVESGAGTIGILAGHRSIHEATTAAASDAKVAATLRFSDVPTRGYGATVMVTARNGDAGSYGARFRLDTQSRGVISLARYDANDQQEVIRQDRLILDSVPEGAEVRVEIETLGADPVSIRARAWVVGGDLPNWQVKAVDESPSAVRTAGTPGVQTYMSGGNEPISVRVDDLTVTPSNPVTTPTEPVPSPSEEPVPTPSEEPTPTPSEEPVPTPSEEPVPTPSEEPVPTPSEEPTPTPSEEPTPTPTTPTEPPADGAVRAGSIPVGQTDYPAPSDAIYVVPAGSQPSGKGTKAAPIAGAQRAIDAAPSGSTLVLRAGTYHESVAVPFHKDLTIQSAPGEAVWFDGSRPVAGWSNSGGTWTAPWSANFDPRVSFSANQDETSWWVSSSAPMAGYPDQVWIDDRRLTQVGSLSAVTADTFFVDTKAKQLVIGTDPTGRSVEASALAKGIKIQGEGTTVRGIGVQRYATTTALLGAVSAEVNGITLENVVIRDNATVGLFIWNDDKVVRNLTVSGNGLLGIAVNSARNLKIETSVVTGNNSSLFNYTPVAGGVKMSRASNVTVTDSIISDNLGSTGLWFDVSSSNLTITNNVFEGNGREGLEIELSQSAVVAGNYIAGNLNSGIFVFDAGDVDIWNNTLVGNGRTITYMQDERRQEVANLRAAIPWVTSDVVVRNNILSYGGQACPMLTQDLTSTWFGNDFGVSQDANLYHRASASSPANFACWADGAQGTRGITTIDAFRALTGIDGRSVLTEGPPVVDPITWQLTAVSPVTAYSLSAKVAEALEVPVQTPRVGALLPPVVAR